MLNVSCGQGEDEREEEMTEETEGMNFNSNILTNCFYFYLVNMTKIVIFPFNNVH